MPRLKATLQLLFCAITEALSHFQGHTSVLELHFSQQPPPQPQSHSRVPSRKHLGFCVLPNPLNLHQISKSVAPLQATLPLATPPFPRSHPQLQYFLAPTDLNFSGMSFLHDCVSGLRLSLGRVTYKESRLQ